MKTELKPKRKATGCAAMGAGPGRPKGSVNKVTVEFRLTVQALLDDNRENISLWLDRVAVDDPARALGLVAKLADFAAPRLARTEIMADLNLTSLPSRVDDFV